MRPNKFVVRDRRVYEVHYQRLGTKCQIWVFEGERPHGVHSTVSLLDAAAAMSAGHDLIDDAMDAAVKDIERGDYDCEPARLVAAE